MVSPENTSRKVNAKGLAVLSNGVVSMQDLDFASQVPTKTRDEDALKLFNACLPLSKTFTLFSIVMFGQHVPVEKHRDHKMRLSILYFAAPYSLTRKIWKQSCRRTLLRELPT
jgi:hypothetical protein